MTQEEKQLLLKDLCARLPYHPILNWKFINNTSKDEELKELSDLHVWWITKAQDCEVKPYLRPMSSMTEEEESEYLDIKKGECDGCVLTGKGDPNTEFMLIDFYNKHHLDYRGLISMGLALEAPEGMYNF